MSVSSDTANIALVHAAVADAAARIGFSVQEVGDIALAVDEAVGNVIKHGYENCGGRPIEVTIEQIHPADNPGIQITLRDRGRHVEPNRLIGRELTDVRPGGLGIHIINSIMDEVEYTQCQPTGMKTRLLRRLTRPAETPRSKTEGEETSAYE